jgi:hypothetical protein
MSQDEGSGPGRPLETELAYFNRRKDELVRDHAGQYVLIKGEELVGAFPTEAQAYEAGLERFGNQPFLIKRAAVEEQAANYLALRFGLLHAYP